VAEELGVRYLVEGSVRRAGDVVRINAQLIDAVSGGHAWAKRFDGSLTDIFALQDQVTAEVVKALRLRLTAGEQQALSQRETDVPAAYDAFLRGWEHYRRNTPADFAKAVPEFEQAIALDPEYWRAQGALALVFYRSYDLGWTASLGKSATELYSRTWEYLEKAKQHPTSISHQIAGNLQRGRGWLDAALKEFDAAIALDPNDSWSYAYKAYALVYAGRYGEAAAAIETAMRLDPNYPPVFVYYRGLTEFSLNKLADAVGSFEQATRLGPDDPWPRLYQAASHGLLGRVEAATAVLAEFDAARIRQGGIPFVTNEVAVEFYYGPFGRPPNRGRLVEGLLRTGAPRELDDPRFASQRIGASELGALFFGHRVHGRTFQTGQEHGVSVSADGVAIMFGDWGSGSGTARLDGDGLCFEWASTTNCGWAYRNIGGTRAKENEYIWYSSAYGGFPFSQVE
ncbi:MAG: tetratricopeptide repeat protein, partial [Dongiaceae bacterium]